MSWQLVLSVVDQVLSEVCPPWVLATPCLGMERDPEGPILHPSTPYLGGSPVLPMAAVWVAVSMGVQEKGLGSGYNEYQVPIISKKPNLLPGMLNKRSGELTRVDSL